MQTAPLQRNLEIPATALETKLASMIARDGPMPVCDFMGHCLYDVDHGYYSTRAPIGTVGDFITAPEVSQMFGELIGAWLASCWLDMGRPAPFELIELGPGRGTLMADALRVASRVEGFSQAARLTLVEVNPGFKQSQKLAIEKFDIPLTWVDDVFSLNPQHPTLMLGNEYLDCLPIRQFIAQGGHVFERCVGLDAGGRLCFTTGPALPILSEGLSDGAVLERNDGHAALVHWLGQLANRMALRCLLIDYGSNHSGVGDTLQALWQHTKVHPLDHIGQADLTAHVDFGRLAELAASTTPKLAVQGPINQGAFLTNLGIQARTASLVRSNPDREIELASALERLTSELYMGALFKVISLSSPGLPDAPALPAS